LSWHIQGMLEYIVYFDLLSFHSVFKGDHMAGDSSDDDDEEDMETEEDFHYAMEEDHRYTSSLLVLNT